MKEREERERRDKDVKVRANKGTEKAVKETRGDEEEVKNRRRQGRGIYPEATQIQLSQPGLI